MEQTNNHELTTRGRVLTLQSRKGTETSGDAENVPFLPSTGGAGCGSPSSPPVPALPR